MIEQVEARAYQLSSVELILANSDPMYQMIADEVVNMYRFDEIRFRPGDVILDVGAHVGITAMYLAKLWPDTKIYSFEPVPEIFDLLKLHLAMNNVRNVEPINLAVTADGRELEMQKGTHSAEATGHYPTCPRAHGDPFTVLSTCIPDFICEREIDHIRLLKLDCEGAEHEILAGSEVWMPMVDYVRGELHMHPWLEEQGYTLGETARRVPIEKVGSGGWQLVEADYYRGAR